MKKYLLLLYTFPLPIIVYIWNSGNVDDLDAATKLLFSIILVLLMVGGYADIYRDIGQTEDD